MRRRPAYENTYLHRLALAVPLALMDANAAMELVMQAHFPVRLIGIPRKLDAVHAHVGLHNAGRIRVFGINLRQRDEGAAVYRPVLDLRNVTDGNLLRHYGALRWIFKRQCLYGGEPGCGILKWMLQCSNWIVL